MFIILIRRIVFLNHFNVVASELLLKVWIYGRKSLLLQHKFETGNNIDDMNTMTLNREASTYWEQLKNASQQVKLELISMLSASLVTPQNEAQAADGSEKLHITQEDLELTPFVSTLGQSIKQLPEDFDYDKAKQEYLMQKYG